jgi:long-chain acyl-CoA synthetase
MVGVPALWELLHRRIRNKLHERSKWIGDTADLLMRANAWLREKTPLNFGPLLFYPIHEGLGGRIRYFISGGSALSEKVQKDFQGLGFTILEGYGLTEASPVLTVTRPQNGMLAGSVGRPLPGVEVKIVDPNESGCTRATSDALTTKAIFTLSDARKRLSLTRTARTFTRTRLKKPTTRRRSSKS